jgi:hypothetical protein
MALSATVFFWKVKLVLMILLMSDQDQRPTSRRKKKTAIMYNGIENL